MPLSDAELASYHEVGYVVRRGLVAPERAQALTDEIDGLHARMAENAPEDVHVSWEEDIDEGRAPRIRQLMHSQRVSPIIENVSRSDELLDILEQIMGQDICLFHSKLMMKSAHDGTFTPWHQDWGYWRRSHVDPVQVNCMLAIDAHDEANGALRFVEGSHKQGEIEHSTFQSSSFNTGLEGGIDDYDAVLVELNPGDAVFFGALVIHGSAPNTSDRHRRANTYAFDVPGNMKEGDYAEEFYRRGRRPAVAV